MKTKPGSKARTGHTEKPFLGRTRAVQSWYVLARSEDLKRGGILTRSILQERIAVYRLEDGTACAVSARCPHLGADLGKGRIQGSSLECAFHRWSFGPDGRCKDRSKPGVFAYPCREQYGLVWVFNGPEPLFDIPSFPGFQFVRMKQSSIAAHPHVLAANGLDTAHFEAVHGLRFHGNPGPRIVDDFSMQVELNIDLNRAGFLFRALRMVCGPTARAVFATTGGNLATIHANAGPIPVYVLFTHRPVSGGSESQTLFFFPRRRLSPLELARRFLAFLIMFAILRDDVDLLSNLDFNEEGLLPQEPMSIFRSHVNKMETFLASEH